MRKAGFSGAFWPTDTQERLICLILGRDEQVVPRWQSLQPLPIDTLDPGSFCLLPHLYLRLKECLPGEPLLPRLAGTYRSSWYRNQLQLERLAGAVAELRRAEVDPIIFGGAALSTRWYSQPGLRPISQIDAIAPPDSGDAVESGMRAAGWNPTGRGRAYRRFVNPEGFVFVVHIGVPPLVAGPLPPDAAFGMVSASASEHDVQNTIVATLDAADELLFACLLGARAVRPPMIQWILDSAAIIAASGGVPPPRLDEQVRAFRAVAPVRETLVYLSEVSETHSGELLSDLLRAGRSSRRQRLAYKLGGESRRPFGASQQSLSLYVRMTADEAPLTAIARLPRYLEEAWQVPARQIPQIAVSKLFQLPASRSGARGAGGTPDGHRTVPPAGPGDVHEY